MTIVHQAVRLLWNEFAASAEIPFAPLASGAICVPPAYITECEAFWIKLVDSLDTLPYDMQWHDIVVCRKRLQVGVLIKHHVEFIICTGDPHFVLTRPPATLSPVLVIGGKSGAGKTSVLQAVRRRWPRLMFSVPQYTTRESRSTECFGQDYYFVDREEHQSLVGRRRFSGAHEIRGQLYWVDRLQELQAIFQGSSRCYVFPHSLPDGIQRARARWPRMLFVWIEASDDDIATRLADRPKASLAATLHYNTTLTSRELADATIINNNGYLRDACSALHAILVKLTSGA